MKTELKVKDQNLVRGGIYNAQIYNAVCLTGGDDIHYTFHKDARDSINNALMGAVQEIENAFKRGQLQSVYKEYDFAKVDYNETIYVVFTLIRDDVDNPYIDIFVDDCEYDQEAIQEPHKILYSATIKEIIEEPSDVYSKIVEAVEDIEYYDQ